MRVNQSQSITDGLDPATFAGQLQVGVRRRISRATADLPILLDESG